MVKTKQVKSF